MRLLAIGLVALVGCGGSPPPQGPGVEPTDTAEQTRKAGPKPTSAPPPDPDRVQTSKGAPAAGGGDGKELPPQYDFELIPRCQGSARGQKTRKPIKSFVGVAQSDLVKTYGPPSCIHRGRWRYEFRAEPCPSYVDTIELELGDGAVRGQKSYRRSTGITCSKPAKKPPSAAGKQ